MNGSSHCNTISISRPKIRTVLIQLRIKLSQSRKIRRHRSAAIPLLRSVIRFARTRGARYNRIWETAGTALALVFGTIFLGVRWVHGANATLRTSHRTYDSVVTDAFIEGLYKAIADVRSVTGCWTHSEVLLVS